MRLVGYIAVFIGGLATCYLLLSLGVVDAIDGIPGTQEEPSLTLPTYLSFMSVMMTAVTTVLAALAIGIGIIAAYTFREIKDEAQRTAAATASQISEGALSEVKVRAMVFELYAKAESQRKSLQELDVGFDPTDSGDR
ncbi:hypothetical protein O9X99_05125 [Agrobacterium salinitolerans]|jgi:putative Mn2+ efflux pump MntP|uniref:Uncharacterized protein n=1 Tax=Agrobacterium salinitolerans TaxID=1183413 RepID=A0ABY3BRB1_9HYPH|nr:MULTISPECIES: hypothetical protein [Agrobacterium]MCZ7891045.1 hypothetical protein [Agrobacterium salinitolerans]TRA93249.1 hypothetical protein EXN23_11240 [Agrobacterium salinitolerans]